MNMSPLTFEDVVVALYCRCLLRLPLLSANRNGLPVSEDQYL